MLIVNDDSSRRADTQRVAHNVSVILLKGSLRLPMGSSRLSGLSQAMRRGPARSCWLGQEGSTRDQKQWLSYVIYVIKYFTTFFASKFFSRFSFSKT